MKKIFISILILGFFLLPSPIRSVEKTNKFGIHILEPTDLPKAKELVNSSGGDWGFVTIVIRDDDLNSGKWQQFFDNCRELHLIPLVRIATRMENNYWIKPQTGDAEKWAHFLDSLNWPTKEQWVIIFNEPNHALEWGNQVSPEEYARILVEFITKLKIHSSNFMIMNAGFDLAAANSTQTMEALLYWQKMEQAVPEIFQKLDGWASHSYPNHGYVGTPFQKGRTSILGYQWELLILASKFGVKKDLPVFITETGWPYKINKTDHFYTPKQVADYFKIAFEKTWLPDERISAVTPFLLSYPQSPFVNFSWITSDNQETEQYLTVKKMNKISWWPPQTFKLVLVKAFLPDFLPTQTEYQGKLILQNIGQSIWGEKEMFMLKPQITDSKLEITSLKIPTGVLVKPNETINFDFTIKSSSKTGQMTYGWEELPLFNLRVIPSSIIIKAEYNLWQKLKIFFEKISLF